MQINYNIHSIIEIIGLIQGVILGSLLLFINQDKVKSTAFLGLFVLVYSLNFVPDILDDLNILEYYPNLNLLPFNFYWLSFPLFYVYVQKISIISNKRTNYWVLYPGIVSIFVNTILFLLPFQTKILVVDSFGYVSYTLVGYAYSLFIGFLTIKWINKHIKGVKNQFTNIEYSELRWARLFVVIGFTFVILSLIIFFAIGENFVFLLIVAITNVTLLYWVSLRGLLQKNVHSLIPNPKKNKAISVPIVKNTLLKLENYIVKEEAFTKSDLTIIDVAKNINEHPKHISSIINSQLNQNFNSYINSFRIEKSKVLITDNRDNSFSIEGIGYEVGFKSKSAFYNSFKKITGTTPARFKNQ